MDIHSDIVTTPPRDAASLILLRNSAQGLEVFLLRRHGQSDVLGGAYVFPGGKLDASDLALATEAHLDQSLAALHASLGEPALAPAQAQGLYVAALREAFEECGVLFANGAGAALAQGLQAGDSFNTVLARLQLRLHTRALAPWSRWVTPRMPSVSSKRFDTRFFVAAMPQDQVALHDDVETTASLWVAPRSALERYWQGALELAPPQIMTLAHLSRFADVASVLQAAHRQAPPLIAPEPFDDAGERVLCYPGDPRHSLPHRAMPGPTRLRVRNRRFEPESGCDSFFA